MTSRVGASSESVSASDEESDLSSEGGKWGLWYFR